MQKKFLFSLLLLTFAIIFSFCYTFAADGSSAMGEAANTVRNVVGGAENGIEDMARDISNTSKDITSDMENGASDTMQSNIENGSSGELSTNTENSSASDMSDAKSTTTNVAGNAEITDNNSRDMAITNSSSSYTAERTSTTGDATLFGMNSTTWIWLILAIVAIAIVALVYYYSVGITNRNNYHEDN